VDGMVGNETFGKVALKVVLRSSALPQ
jgi:hypothetical protein